VSAIARALPQTDAVRTVLVIDDEPDIRQLVALSLSRIGIDTHTAANLVEARELLATYAFGACLTDMRLPDGNGVAFVAEVAAAYPDLPIAVITAHGQTDAAVQAMKNGAFDFVSKPVDLQVLRRLVEQALRIHPPGDMSARTDPWNVSANNTSVARTPCTPPLLQSAASDDGKLTLIDGEKLIGTSTLMQALRERIAKVARTNAPVWITGESGTGKELVARLIHANSPRSGGPFVAINCGAIPSELMESELFGHRKGAFTGAHQDKEGLFCVAEAGTLFLDEIAELPLHMQVKLLRAIQERSVRPVGASEERSFDVRLLSASHSDLVALVESGAFRQDLYYRLNVILIRAPSLRDRATDIPALAEAILSRLRAADSSTVPSLTTSALDRLVLHEFPGNVRELENILERACALAACHSIEADDLELETSTVQVQAGGSLALDHSDLPTERDTILAALEATLWNRRRSAAMLGMTYRQLRYRIQRLNLDNREDSAK